MCVIIERHLRTHSKHKPSQVEVLDFTLNKIISNKNNIKQIILDRFVNDTEE